SASESPSSEHKKSDDPGVLDLQTQITALHERLNLLRHELEIRERKKRVWDLVGLVRVCNLSSCRKIIFTRPPHGNHVTGSRKTCPFRYHAVTDILGHPLSTEKPACTSSSCLYRGSMVSL